MLTRSWEPFSLAAALVAIIVLWSIPAWPQMPDHGPVPSAAPQPFSFRARHLPPERVIEVLVPIFPGLHFREDPFYGVVTVDVTPDRLEPLQKVLELLDVPRDPVDLTVHLLWGRRSTFRGAVPREVRSAEKELRARFKFERYDLGNTLFLPVLERGKGKAELYPDCTLEYAVDRVDPGFGQVDMRLDVSRLSIRGDRLASLLQTNQRVSVGHPCVVGGVPVHPNPNSYQGTDQRRSQASSGRALILVIEVELSEPSIPDLEAGLVDRSEG